MNTSDRKATDEEREKQTIKLCLYYLHNLFKKKHLSHSLSYNITTVI